MEKEYFKNSFELAYYFVNKNTDSREWGVCRPFAQSPIWKKFFWEMGDKYFRGKAIITPFISPEYQDCKRDTISAFIEFIENETDLIFPLTYTSKVVDADGRFTSFAVNFETDNQLTFIKDYEI